MKSLRIPNSMMLSRAALGKILLVPVLLLLSLSSLFAAEFWEKKTYYEWTDKECATMLTNSPWAWELKVLRETALGSSDSSQGQQFVSYLIQFQSALPIRQAKVRQAQLQNKYDTLSKEQKQAFDKSTEAFLNADYSDKVVVSVTYSTNIQKLNEIQNMDMELARTWQSKTLGVLSNSVFLYASKGEKAHLLDFNVGQGAQRSFQFIFPRQVGGKPIATDQDKSLILEFPYPADDAWKMGTGRGYAEFKVKKMILNGGLIY